MTVKTIKKLGVCYYSVIFSDCLVRRSADGGQVFEGYTKKEVVRILRQRGHIVPHEAI